MAQMVTRALPSGREVFLEIIREVLPVQSAGHLEFDPDWRFTDAAGHEHGGPTETFSWVVTGSYWCESCNDMHEEGEWRCQLCGEAIKRGTRWRSEEYMMIPAQTRGSVKVTDGAITSWYALVNEDFESFRALGDGTVTDEWLDSVVARDNIVMQETSLV